jgi:xanthine/uracil permease
LYAKGRIFTAQSVAQIRQVGLTFAFGLAIWLLVLFAAWPEISAAQDQWLNIMPSFPGGAIVGACLFLFASRIMDEGRKLREEQDLVV